MCGLIILFIGTFWEASMDIIGSKHNYDHSYWKMLADYFDRSNRKQLGNKFWDNSKAWSNKWKNNDPTQGEAFWGSSTIFVTLCDGWHLVKFMWLMHLFVAIVCYEKITHYFLLDLLLLYLVFGMGHELFGRILTVKRAPRDK